MKRFLSAVPLYSKSFDFTAQGGDKAFQPLNHPNWCQKTVQFLHQLCAQRRDTDPLRILLTALSERLEGR